MTDNYCKEAQKCQYVESATASWDEWRGKHPCLGLCSVCACVWCVWCVCVVWFCQVQAIMQHWSLCILSLGCTVQSIFASGRKVSSLEHLYLLLSIWHVILAQVFSIILSLLLHSELGFFGNAGEHDHQIFNSIEFNCCGHWRKSSHKWK